MKKSLIVFAFLLLILPLISSIQIDVKDEFKQGESLIAKISGEFLQPILKENIFFYRDVYTAVPFEFELLKIENNYFIFTDSLDKTSGNYSIIIEDSEYYVAGGKTSLEDISINFSISGNYADFSVKPGVSAKEGPFSLEIQNLKEEQITVYVNKNSVFDEEEKGFFESLFGSSGDKSQQGQPFTFDAGETKKITLEFENLTKSELRKVILSTSDFSTEVFVYSIYSGQEPKEEIKRIKFDVEVHNVSLIKDSESQIILLLKNLGTTTFENVTFEISDSLKDYAVLNKTFVEDFETDDFEQIILVLKSKGKPEKIQGSVKARTNDEIYAYSEIYLEIVESFIPKENLTGVDSKQKNELCGELNGTICEAGKEICQGEKTKSSDTDSCCLGQCVEKQESNTGKIIAWSIIILFLLIYIWFYLKKYKKTSRKLDLLEVAEGKGIGKRQNK